MRKRLKAGFRWGVVGVIPGLLLILLARFVIQGEMQLTVGAPAILLAIVGGLAGFILAFRKGAGGS
ncbi:MAG: hypothetical protein M3198_16670 [Actinomycetota bacterium]|nr:hypothetical protein [Actinomycetota bacterium]